MRGKRGEEFARSPHAASISSAHDYSGWYEESSVWGRVCSCRSSLSVHLRTKTTLSPRPQSGQDERYKQWSQRRALEHPLLNQSDYNADIQDRWIQQLWNMSCTARTNNVCAALIEFKQKALDLIKSLIQACSTVALLAQSRAALNSSYHHQTI